MKVRVLFCAGSLEGGGSERQLWQLAANLPDSLFQSEFYLLKPKGIYLERLPKTIRVHSWRHHPLASPWIPGSIHRSQVSQLTAVLRREKINIVYDRGFHSTLVSAPACRRAGVKRISVIVSPPSQDFDKSPERFRRLKHSLLKNAYSDPSSITVAVSSDVAEDAAEYFNIPAESIVTIPNPVDCEAVRGLAGESLLQESSSPMTSQQRHDRSQQEDFRVAIVGRLTAEKGHSLLLDAISLWQKNYSTASNTALSLQIIGEGPLREELTRLSQQLGIDHQVQWLGFHENPYPLMAKADLICIPSKYEGFPNVALEAMALGTPLVVSPIGVLVRLVGDRNQRGLAFPACSPAGIAHAIEHVINEPELARRRAEQARKWVVEQYDLPRWLLRAQQLIMAGLKDCSQQDIKQLLES